jgi:hypothetical protein
LHHLALDVFVHLEELVKRIRTGIVTIGLALVGLVFACAREGAVKPMQLGEAFTLKIGESGKLASDDLTITFKGVTSDSRCPQGVVCVHAGEADVVLAVEHGGKRQDVTVKVGAGSANKATIEPFAIRVLKLDPYPTAGQSIADAERVIELRVDRTGD